MLQSLHLCYKYIIKQLTDKSLRFWSIIEMSEFLVSGCLGVRGEAKTL